jgi:dienelactone hydrolase
MRAMTIDDALLRHLYRYDRTLPLLATSEPEAVITLVDGVVTPIEGVRRERVTFGSTHDERVLATLTYPESGGPFPAVIMQHGSSALGRHYWPQRGIDVAWPREHGFMTVAVDALGFGSRETPDNRGRLARNRPDLMFRTRDQRIQNVQDLMRTVDYLCTRPDVRGDAIGFLGVSMGTRVGVPFVGLDPRVRAAAFFIGGSGPYSGFEVAGTELADLESDERLITELTDPARFAPMIVGRPVFVLNGTRDTVVGPGAGERLQEAFEQPKTLRWFEGDHAQVPPAMYDKAAEFLAGHLLGPAAG